MMQAKLIGAAIGLLALIGAFFYGRSTGIDHERAKYAKAMAKAAVALDKSRRAIDRVSGQLQEARNAQDNDFRVIQREVPTIISRPVYRNRCVDADGVSLLDRAVAAANRGLASAPVGGAGAVSDASEER